MPAAAAAALKPERERPAELMGNGTVLMGGDVTFGINDARAEDVVPLLAQVVGVMVGGHSRPQRSVRKPFIPKRGLGAGAGIMQPKEFTQTGHFLFVAGHGEMGKVVRRRGVNEGGGAKERGQDEAWGFEHYFGRYINTVRVACL